MCHPVSWQLIQTQTLIKDQLVTSGLDWNGQDTATTTRLLHWSSTAMVGNPWSQFVSLLGRPALVGGEGDRERGYDDQGSTQLSTAQHSTAQFGRTGSVTGIVCGSIPPYDSSSSSSSSSQPAILHTPLIYNCPLILPQRRWSSFLSITNTGTPRRLCAIDKT